MRKPKAHVRIVLKWGYPHLLFLILRLVDEDVNMIMYDDSGSSLLQIASGLGQMDDVLPALLEHPYLDKGYRNNHGRTALDYACDYSSPKSQKWLLASYMFDGSRQTLFDFNNGPNYFEFEGLGPHDNIKFQMEAMRRTGWFVRDWAAWIQALLIMTEQGYLRMHKGFIPFLKTEKADAGKRLFGILFRLPSDVQQLICSAVAMRRTTISTERIQLALACFIKRDLDLTLKKATAEPKAKKQKTK